MLRSLMRLDVCGRQMIRACSTGKNVKEASRPWEDPWKHALKPQESTLTEVEELSVDWSYVARLMPHEVVPEVPKHETYPTPSGWRPPSDSASMLPYFIRRTREHIFPLYLERRRNELNENSLEFDYVELVVLRGVDGDVFECESDLRNYLEEILGTPVATHVDELKGRITVRGAERSLVEKFLFDKGF